MGLKDLKFVFDNPQQIYYGGQAVSGRLLVNLDDPKKLRSIMIKFKGEAGVQWTETQQVYVNGVAQTNSIIYTNRELYFEHNIKVFGGTGTTEILPSGEHCFPFSMTLPPNLPTSFEGLYGHVRYTVKATLDRPWKFDHEAKAAFTVLSHVDLNMDPTLMEPLKSEDSKHFGFLMNKSGPLSLVTSIPVRGYVPGQSIPITVSVGNASKVEVSSVNCELHKIVKYHSKQPMKKTQKQDIVVTKVQLQGSSVGAKESKTLVSEICIPPLPASHLQQCNIMDLEYRLLVKAKAKGAHTNLENKVAIVIGTIPIWFTNAEHTSGMFCPPPYPDMPAPAYKECEYGTADISDVEDSKYMFGAGKYTPQYPTYTLPAVITRNPSSHDSLPPKH